MKNPFHADAIVLKNGGVIETEAGTDIVSVDSSGVVTIATTTQTVVDLTTTGNTTIGNASGDTLAMNSLTTVATNQKIQFRDTGLYLYSSADGTLNVNADTILAVTAPNTNLTGILNVGVNDTGYDVNFFGATAGKKLFWDESADTAFLTCTVDIDGTVTVGVDDTGYDVKFFGDTASNSWLWDTSADKVVQTFVSGSTDGGTSVEPYTITSTMTGIGGVGGRFKSQLTVNAAAGGWTNAIKGEAIYGASGRTDGLGSAVLAEMTLSAGTTSGTYAPVEVELNCGSNSPIGTDTSLIYGSVNGTATAFLAGGHLMSLQGLGAASSASNIFHTTGTVSATHGLRINIGGVDYDILLKASTYA